MQLMTHNTRHAHRVNTARAGGDMTNLNDTPSLGKLTAADFARRVTPTRRGLLYRARRLVRIVWLRFEISSAEEWIAACDRDGIYDTNSLRDLARELQVMRVRLAIEEAS